MKNKVGKLAKGPGYAGGMSLSFEPSDVDYQLTPWESVSPSREAFLAQEALGKMPGVFFGGSYVAGLFLAEADYARDTDVFFGSEAPLMPPQYPGTKLFTEVFYPGGAVQLIDSFDFRCVQFAANSSGIWHAPYAIDDVLDKFIRVHRAQPSLGQRLHKYGKRGFHLHADSIPDVVEALKS